MTVKPPLFRPDRSTPEGTKKFDGRKNITALYDKAWTKYRLRFLKENPTCYACGKPSEVVDHLEVHQGDVVKFEKTGNHIPLCETCHNTITAKFDRFGPRKYIDKLTWMSAQRAKYGVTTRVRVLAKYRE